MLQREILLRGSLAVLLLSTAPGLKAPALAEESKTSLFKVVTANGELQQAPTAKIGLIASSSLRVELYTTPYAVVPHQ